MLNGKRLYVKMVILNVIRWDMFEKLLKFEDMLQEEWNFQKLYQKLFFFLFIYMGVKVEVFFVGIECYYLVFEDEWLKLEELY